METAHDLLCSRSYCSLDQCGSNVLGVQEHIYPIFTCFILSLLLCLSVANALCKLISNFSDHYLTKFATVILFSVFNAQDKFGPLLFFKFISLFSNFSHSTNS